MQKFNIRLFLDGKYIDPSEYKNIQINCRAVDRIVNRIYELNHADDSTVRRRSSRNKQTSLSTRKQRKNNLER